MKITTRSFWKSLAIAAAGLMAVAIAFAAPPVMAVAGAARGLYVAVKRWTVDLVHTGLVLFQRSEPDRTPAAVTLVRAKAFYSSLVNRARPRMTDGWRMCPSI